MTRESWKEAEALSEAVAPELRVAVARVLGAALEVQQEFDSSKGELDVDSRVVELVEHARDLRGAMDRRQSFQGRNFMPGRRKGPGA